jgi:DEAD/DEAH box helicase domain-containing protein
MGSHDAMKNRVLVIDIETQNTFDEVGGRDHLADLRVSVVGVYDSATDDYYCLEEKELGTLQNHLIDASLVIGFNHLGFDLPVLQSYFSIDVTSLPCLDLMADIQKRIGHRVSLDSLAQATLGLGKTGHGLDAIRYFREGKIKELKEYCLNDVKVTRDVYEFGVKHGRVFYLSKVGGEKKEVAVDWGVTAPQIMKQVVSTPAQYKLF